MPKRAKSAMAKAHVAESKIMARRVIKYILDIPSSLIVAATSLSKRSCSAAEPGSCDLVNSCKGLLYQVHHQTLGTRSVRFSAELLYSGGCEPAVRLQTAHTHHDR